MAAAGPLGGMTVIEMAVIGPVPHCGLVLRELGADVLRIDRTVPPQRGIDLAPEFDALARGKRTVALDLKAAAGRGAAMDLIGAADILIGGFRPGVMERLGLGPLPCLSRNPRLVYGRLPGWGSAGPMADQAGHDLNYLGLSGALAAMGPPGAPPPVPLNLIADFGGGAMQLAVGVLAASLQARRSGLGQVVAASILEGTLALTPMMHGMRAGGVMSDARHDNVLDGGAPFYRCYQARDGGYVAVAAIEAKFYRALIAGLGLLDALDPSAQMDKAQWDEAHGWVVVEAMRRAPINDPLFGTVTIGAGGRAVHDIPRFQVKAPADSHGPYDYYRLVATIPVASAFRPLDQGECPMLKP